MVANLAISYSAPVLIEELRKDGFIIDRCSHEAQSFTPKFSNKPTDKVPFIRQDGGGICLDFGTWSIPGPPGRGQASKVRDIINANANTVAEGGGFYNDMRSSQRAIVACDGFYASTGKGKNFKSLFVRRKDRKPIYMAVLYVDIKGASIFGFAIINTTAGEGLCSLHTMQPVLLLGPKVAREWVDTSSKEWTARHRDIILNTDEKQSEILECYEVPRQLRGTSDSPSLIEPITPPTPVIAEYGIPEAFQRQTSRQSQLPANKGPESQDRTFRLTGPRKLQGKKRKRGRKPPTAKSKRKAKSGGTSSNSSSPSTSSQASNLSRNPRIRSMAPSPETEPSSTPVPTSQSQKATAASTKRKGKRVGTQVDTAAPSPSQSQSRKVSRSRSKKGKASAVDGPVLVGPLGEDHATAEAALSLTRKATPTDRDLHQETAPIASSSKATLDDLPAQRVKGPKKPPAKRRKKVDPADSCAKLTAYFNKKT